MRHAQLVAFGVEGRLEEVLRELAREAYVAEPDPYDVDVGEAGDRATEGEEGEKKEKAGTGIKFSIKHKFKLPKGGACSSLVGAEIDGAEPGNETVVGKIKLKPGLGYLFLGAVVNLRTKAGAHGVADLD